MAKEVWKVIPKYEGSYEVSNQGRVRSLDRYVERSSNGRRLFKGQILKLGKDFGGYSIVGLYINGNKTTYSVHVLVLLSFKGGPPQGKEVGHRNGMKADNKLINLRYITRIENCHDNIKHGTSSAKLTEEDVKEIRGYKNQLSRKVLAKEYGVNQGTISNVLLRRTWKHI